jgi:hypothetical protein
LPVTIADQWPLNVLPVTVINTATVSGGGSESSTASDKATVNRKQQSVVAAVPTMTELGMIIFVLLLGLGSVYYLMKQQKDGV